MKKILLLALFAVCSLGAQAQIISSYSRSISVVTENETKESKPKDGFSYFKVGLNLSKFSADDLSRNAGYSIFYGFARDFTDIGLYWGMEFGLSTRGFNYDYGSGNYYCETKLTAHNIQIAPINFGYKYEVIGNFKIDLHLGAYVSYDYAGEYEYYRPYDDHYSDHSIKNLSDYHGYHRYDVGLNYGFGVWFKDKINLDFMFQNGFMNCWGGYGKTRNFTIRLGYAF